MSEALAALLKIIVVIALVAGITAVVWSVVADETEVITNRENRIDYPRFDTEDSCEAIGGTWDATNSTCGP